MEFMSFLGSALVASGFGAAAILILAVVQEGKLGGKGSSVRNGFFAAVSLVLLGIAVAATAFTVRLGLASWVFPKAPYSYSYAVDSGRGTPPYPVLVTKEIAPANANATDTATVRTCATGCAYTSEEVTAIHTWASEYRAWLAQPTVDSTSNAKRRDLVNALSFLLVSAPLFVVFFRAVRRRASNQPNVVRSVYFYYAAFAGLVMAVVAGALLLNVGLKALAGVEDVNSSTQAVPVPTIVSTDPYVQYVKGIASCASSCGFTAEEVTYASRYASDVLAAQQYKAPETSAVQGDLAANIPLLAVGLPLFWYHFATIRRDTHEEERPAPSKRSGSRKRRST